jgi:hypothetical protein
MAALLQMDMPTWGITDYPLVMVPTFAVPLSYVLHIASLTKISLERKAAAAQ